MRWGEGINLGAGRALPCSPPKRVDDNSTYLREARQDRRERMQGPDDVSAAQRRISSSSLVCVCVCVLESWCFEMAVT